MAQSKAKVSRPPEQTFEEIKYLKHLIDQKITVCVKLSDDEEVRGVVEYYDQPPKPNQRNEANMYGGRWLRDPNGGWKLVWTETAIKDFYLNNILIHELGHLLDDRNGEGVLVVVVLRVGQDLLVDELVHHLGDGLLLVGLLGVRGGGYGHAD